MKLEKDANSFIVKYNAIYRRAGDGGGGETKN